MPADHPSLASPDRYMFRFLALSVIFCYLLSFISRSVKAIKPLGCLAMIDDGELDWKVRALAGMMWVRGLFRSSFDLEECAAARALCSFACGKTTTAEGSDAAAGCLAVACQRYSHVGATEQLFQLFYLQCVTLQLAVLVPKFPHDSTEEVPYSGAAALHCSTYHWDANR